VPVQLDVPEGSRAPSVSALELSVRIPRKARKLFQIGIKALRNSRPGDAQQLLAEALRVEPNYFQASTLLAALLFNSKDYPAAQLYVERARNINPQYLPALEILGALDVLKGEYPKGIAELSEVVHLSPRRQAAHHYLGLALMQQGQCAEASRHLERAADLRLHPPKPKRPLQEPGISAYAYPPGWPWNPRGHH
jgi:tetratricopeptide (TPR) repeat protein